MFDIPKPLEIAQFIAGCFVEMLVIVQFNAKKMVGFLTLLEMINFGGIDDKWLHQIVWNGESCFGCSNKAVL